MDTGDIFRQMNEDARKGKLQVLELEALDYVLGRKEQIKVVRNNDTFDRDAMATVRLSREFNRRPEKIEDDLDPEDYNLRSQGVIYKRNRAEEVKAREDFILQEKSRINERLELASPRDRQERLQYEIDNYNEKRTVPDFNTLIKIYNDWYPRYGAPNEWWLDEVYANNIILDWLDKLASDNGNHGVSPSDPKSKKFIKSRADQKTNGARGGELKAERRYQQFVKWVDHTKFKVDDYRETSIANFASILKEKGFAIDGKPISPNTAASYRSRYLSELDQSFK